MASPTPAEALSVSEVSSLIPPPEIAKVEGTAAAGVHASAVGGVAPLTRPGVIPPLAHTSARPRVPVQRLEGVGTWNMSRSTSMSRSQRRTAGKRKVAVYLGLAVLLAAATLVAVNAAGSSVRHCRRGERARQATWCRSPRAAR